jgi:hypothetical protein
MIVFTVVVVFFLNRFLFFICGYSTQLLHDTVSVAAFEAYRAVYKVKIFMIFAGMISSVILLFFGHKFKARSPYWSAFIIYGICWLMAIIFLAICLFFFVFPTGALI